MAKYSYITDKTHNNRKIQVESAKRDGSGKNIENNYAKQNGNYQSLTAGLSNNFDTKQVMVDESAYNFRPTATMGSVELEVGSPCKVKKIIGGSVAFNQLVHNGNFADNTSWTPYNGINTSISIANNELSQTFLSAGKGYQYGVTQNLTDSQIANHKYLISVTINTPVSGIYGVDVDNTPSGKTFTVSSSDVNKWFTSNIVYNSAGSTARTFLLEPLASNSEDIPQGTIIKYKNIQFIDLTQMFGSTIADYIYSLEQANAGSGVAWFKRYFPKEYYDYNSGELVSVKTQGKKITHFNQWDEVVEIGALNNGVLDPTETSRITTSYVRVIPNETYYFKSPTSASDGRVAYYDSNKNFISQSGSGLTPNANFLIPNNAYYLRLTLGASYGSTYNHDICINFHYDGERDGEYEPYNSETYACDDEELRGIPQLDENNNLVFDGDEYANDGNVKRKYGIVDLGTLNWAYDSTNQFFYVLFGTSAGRKLSTNLMCSKYVYKTPIPWNGDSDVLTYPDKTITTNGVVGGYIYIKDTSYNDATTFKTSLNGVYMVYELETPTTENSIPFTEVQECDNWGTEEWLAPTTDTRPCEVPVGHETDYLPDLKAKLEVAPNTPNENGVYVMEHNASGNSYTPIATWLQANGYVNEISANAIKENIGGALRHQLAQANNIDFNNTAWVDLGELSWSYDDTNMYFNANVTNLKPAGSNTTKANILCAIYKTDTWNNTAPSGSGVNGNISVNGTSPKLGIRNTNYTSSSSFKNAMKGILLAYEKAS